MKKHDLLKDGNNIIRVLEILPDKILTIDCVKRTMPVWVGRSALDSFSVCNDEVLIQTTNFTVTDIENLNADQKRTMYDRYTLIAPILPFIADERIRSKLIGSTAILGRSGAEKLLGKGQMIFDSLVERDKRLQGSFITKTDMKKLLDEIKETYVQKNKYHFNFNEVNLTSAIMGIESGDSILMNPKTSRSNSEDEKLPDAIIWSLSQNTIANSRLQNYLKIGNNRASRILKRMEELCLLERMHGKLGWEVMPEYIEDMSVEVIKLLRTYGRTEIDINSALLKRSSDIANI